MILSQDSIYGVKSSSQCVQQILKMTFQGYMPLWRRRGVWNFSSYLLELKSYKLKCKALKIECFKHTMIFIHQITCGSNGLFLFVISLFVVWVINCNLYYFFMLVNFILLCMAVLLFFFPNLRWNWGLLNCFLLFLWQW